MYSKYLLIMFGLFFIDTTDGQNFKKIIPQGSVGLTGTQSQWLDFDNDGDLDFVITGQKSTNDLRTILYENLLSAGDAKPQIFKLIKK